LLTVLRRAPRARLPAPALAALGRSPLWQDLLAPLTHRPRAALKALAHPGRYAAVERFLFFVGYPRSGHTLVGSLLNAHPEALVSHELHALKFVHAGATRAELYTLIEERDAWFADLGRQWTGYDYTVPGQWQGRWERLRLIGDKRGGGSSDFLLRHPTAVGALVRRVGVPVAALHHVRDPFDNIATMARKDGPSLEGAIARYFALAEASCAALAALPPEGRLLSYHEDLVADPHAALERLAAGLGLRPDPAWRDACAARVFPSPRRSREQVTWTAAAETEVRRRMAAFPHLARYLAE